MIGNKTATELVAEVAGSIATLSVCIKLLSVVIRSDAAIEPMFVGVGNACKTLVVVMMNDAAITVLAVEVGNEDKLSAYASVLDALGI